jgi:hypothetical protein
MPMPLARILLLSGLLAATACHDDAAHANSLGGRGSAEQTSLAQRADGGAAPAVEPLDPSAELYDDQRVARFMLEVPPTELAALRRDPDTYVRATLRYQNEVVNDVGLRIKGEGSRRTLDGKAAFKIKIDAFVAGQSFRGLRRLTLNNMVEDPSFLAERLAYHVFRAAGLPAPRCNSAEVVLNGQAYGLYANVESEDKTFLGRWFDDDDGNLYEEGQSDFVRGAEAKFDLETNASSADRSDLRRMIEVVSTPPVSGTLLRHWDAVLDTTQWLRFTAAEAAVNQWDMYAYTVFYPNNFRLYHDPSRAQFVFLPWGMDMSMKPYRDSGRAHIPLFTLARQYDLAWGKVTSGLLFQKCLQDADCKQRYAGALRELVTVYERADLATLAAQYHAQIAPLVRADPRKEYSEAQFASGYAALLSTIRTRPAAMRAELARVLPAP